MIAFACGFVVGGIAMAFAHWAFRRLEAQEKCILDLLAGPEAPFYGLELIERSGGLLSRGTVYVLLGRLQDRGLVDATAPDSDGRRLYRLARRAAIADRIFDGAEAQFELDRQLEAAGAVFERTTWDDYDNSLELKDVPPEHRLSVEAQRVIHAAGFTKVYVNHIDKWETHYVWKHGTEFSESKGWRVSYPHKRGEGEEGIWVEAFIEGWPKEWFDTGYVLIKPTPQYITDIGEHSK